MILGMGCSTKKNTPGTRAYHELTTRYNIYFNASEAYNEILENQPDNFPENHTTLLPFYPSVPVQEEKTHGGPFDPVADKLLKAIQTHSITAKPRRNPSQPQTQALRQWLQQEEFNPFIHNVWMLLGKVHLQNRDYEDALETFMQIQRLFKQEKDLITETEIWLLRIYTETNRTYDAENIIYMLQSKTLPPHLHDLYMETYTAWLIHRKEYAAAIPWLKKTIDRERNFRQKKRLQFLLGQIYALNGEKAAAYRAFEDVKGLRTPAEFSRNATLAQLALQERPVTTEIPDPTEKNSSIIKPDLPADGLNSDSTLMTNPEQAYLFQDYYRAYLKRSSVREPATESIPRPSSYPETATPFPAQSSSTHRTKTMEELKKQLEQKAAEALRQNQKAVTNKSREKLLKEREKERKEKIRQRERELRERQRKREATIRQREQQREQQMREQQRQ